MYVRGRLVRPRTKSCMWLCYKPVPTCMHVGQTKEARPCLLDQPLGSTASLWDTDRGQLRREVDDTDRDTIQRWSSISETILQTITEEDCDLIPLVSCNISGRKQWQLGRIANALASKIQQPVLVIKQLPHQRLIDCDSSGL